jgi:phosphoribosyl 1,2-cyclic phosphodiesterase
MKVTLWGTRGSVPSPGPDTERLGGNTACVSVQADEGALLVLDAGTGIRMLGSLLKPMPRRVDILLTHLHLDHIQGLGFFAPLFDPNAEVHIWGPASTTLDLRGCLSRYLSPPLFPVLLRDLPCDIHLHDVPCEDVAVGPFRITSSLVCHPGPTVGYRIACDGAAMTYLPDHEPAFGVHDFPMAPEWTSGYDLAADVDLLIHDAQYTSEEYASRIGWGHSSLLHMLAFAKLARVRHALVFHHDPTHSDTMIEAMIADAVGLVEPAFRVSAATEREGFELRG